MNTYKDPANFWEERLSQNFDLTGVGHGSVGPYYNQKLYEARLRAFERALEKFEFQIAGASILDIGCGTGFYTEYCAAKNVASYIGVDLTEVSINNLRDRYPQFEFMKADITRDNLNFATKFDYILVPDVLYHIVDDMGFQTAMQRLCTLLKPEGTLIIADVFPKTSSQISPHVKLRSLSDYELILQESDLKVTHLESVFITLQPPVSTPDMPLMWRLYTQIWRILPLALAWRPLEILVANTLTWLDLKLLPNGRGRYLQTVKWLLASRSYD